MLTFCPTLTLFGGCGSSSGMYEWFPKEGVEFLVFKGEVLALLLRGEEGTTRSHTAGPHRVLVSTNSTKECLTLDLFCFNLPMAVLYRSR